MSSNAFRGPGPSRTNPPRDSSDQLITDHQEFVRALAWDLHRKLSGIVELDELVSLGNVGLVKAARVFDPMCGASFKTYAYYRIRGEMFDGVRRSSWSRTSRTVLRNEEARDDAAQHAAGLPIDAGISKLEEEFSKGVRRLAVIQLVGEFHDHDQQDSASWDPFLKEEARERRTHLQHAIECLEKDQRQLIHDLYVECKSMTECASSAGVHKSTITRRHQDALDSLRSFIERGSADPPRVDS